MNTYYRTLLPEDYYQSAGKVDGRCGPFSDHLFLLNENGKVVGRRAALATPAQGESFFDALPAAPEEERFERLLLGYVEDSYLLQAAQTPLLLFRCCFPSTRMLPILLPPPPVAKILSRPGAYAQNFDPHLTFSRHSLSRYAPAREEHYQICEEWLSPLHQTFFLRGADNNLARTVSSVVVHILTRLARLCGICLHYDVSGLGFAPIPSVNYHALTGSLIALFLLARRVADDHSLLLFVDREGPDTPVIHAVLRVISPEDSLSELDTLREISPLRGRLFAVTRLPEEPSVLHVRFTFNAKELSLQELRNAFPFPTS